MLRNKRKSTHLLSFGQVNSDIIGTLKNKYLYSIILHMKLICIEKNKRTQNIIEQLLNVWESSVKATHLFLSENEIKNIKQYVPQALKEVMFLIIAVDETNTAIAFMGIENNKLEMLFVSAEERGKGIGTKLIQYGIKEHSINELTVNEQNPKAQKFYEHNGFQVYKRTQTDEQGNPYPLLYMKLK